MILMNGGLAADRCPPRLFVDVCLLIHVLQGVNGTVLSMGVSLCLDQRCMGGCAKVSGKMFAVSSALLLKKAEGGQMQRWVIAVCASLGVYVSVRVWVHACMGGVYVCMYV